MGSTGHMVMMNLVTSSFHIYYGDYNDPSSWVMIPGLYTDLREASEKAMDMDLADMEPTTTELKKV